MPQNKRALCVGINNYPGGNNDLKGCVNDARSWAELLKNHFGFSAANIRLLLDDQATKQNTLDELKKLIAGAKSGDVLVFTNSSHGTYIADQNGDESYDEAVCAVDVNIVDDDLRKLFNKIPSGVRLTAILDNCHSGTATRLPLNADARKRFMNPQERGSREIDLSQAVPKASGITQSQMKEVLLSGCKADEVSWDVKIGNTYHGAMTFCAIEVIKAANYQITYEKLHERLIEMLEDNEYDQTPQLEGQSANKKRQIFS